MAPTHRWGNGGRVVSSTRRKAGRGSRAAREPRAREQLAAGLPSPAEPPGVLALLGIPGPSPLARGLGRWRGWRSCFLRSSYSVPGLLVTSRLVAMGTRLLGMSVWPHQETVSRDQRPSPAPVRAVDTPVPQPSTQTPSGSAAGREHLGCLVQGTADNTHVGTNNPAVGAGWGLENSSVPCYSPRERCPGGSGDILVIATATRRTGLTMVTSPWALASGWARNTPPARHGCHCHRGKWKAVGCLLGRWPWVTLPALPVLTEPGSPRGAQEATSCLWRPQTAPGKGLRHPTCGPSAGRSEARVWSVPGEGHWGQHSDLLQIGGDLPRTPARPWNLPELSQTPGRPWPRLPACCCPGPAQGALLGPSVATPASLPLASEEQWLPTGAPPRAWAFQPAAGQSPSPHHPGGSGGLCGYG